MNNYDKIFFKKYLPSTTKMKAVIHQHLIVIINRIIFHYFFLVLLPSFLYYYSDRIKSFIPFFVLEFFLVGMFIKIIYEIIDWYNDAWIVTNEGVINFEWRILGVSMNSIKFENIEGIELIQDGFFDTFLSKGDIIIHKLGGGDEDFLMRNASVPYEAVDVIEKYSKKYSGGGGHGSGDHGHGHDDHGHAGGGEHGEHGNHEEEEEDNSKENYDVIVKALSGVIEDYLHKTGYKKDNSKEKKEYIENVKKQRGTIDLNSEEKSHGHGHDEEDEEEDEDGGNGHGSSHGHH